MKKSKSSASAKSTKKAQRTSESATVKSKVLATKPKSTSTPTHRPKLSGLDAAAKILGESINPMSCPDLMKTMLERGLWSTTGKTPAATLHSALLREITDKGKQSRFTKVGRGLFALTS